MSVEKVTREERNPKYSRRITRSNDYNENISNLDTETNQTQKSDISVINSGNRFEVIYTDIDKVRPYNEQSRTYFDESEIMALSKTISEHGIRQPLTVIGSEEGFQVVSGERRLRAAKLAGLKKVPIVIISDDKKAEELALIENIQRVDLHPIELGRAYSKIMSRTRENAADLADRISVPINQVYEYSAYAKIPNDITELIIKHSLGRRAFLRELLKYSQEEMIDIVANEVLLKDQFSTGASDTNSSPSSSKPTTSSLQLKKENLNLLSIKMKNGKLHIKENGIFKCNKSELPLIKKELSRILELIEKMN